jgi:hypothetical protein
MSSNLTAEGRAKGRTTANAHQADRAVAEYRHLLPRIVRLRAGGATLRAIADNLNRAGHTTRTGATWSQVQVKRLLDRTQA